MGRQGGQEVGGGRDRGARKNACLGWGVTLRLQGSAHQTELEPLRAGRREKDPGPPGAQDWDWLGQCRGPVPSGPVVLTQLPLTSLFSLSTSMSRPLPQLLRASVAGAGRQAWASEGRPEGSPEF